jgi:hypothetical protein
MTLCADRGELRAELLARIRAGADAPLDEPVFDRLARRVFAFQYDANGAYRAYCDRRGQPPDEVRHWTEIPAVPTSAFKAVPLVCGDPASAQVVFRTSGTTAGRDRRGEHHLLDTALYDAALSAGFAAHLLPDGARLPVLSMIPAAVDVPDSSLAYMAGAVIREYGARGSRTFVGPDGPEIDAMCHALASNERDREPVCILATSLALAHLLDRLEAEDRRFALAAGSRLMDTGGFKGLTREVTREELYARVRARLGLEPTWCVNEYGMTEMASQFYDTRAGDPDGGRIAGRRYQGPGWVRSRVVDPESLEILPAGEVGALRHWDLANLDSVLVLQTEDLGACEPAGFRLLGRAADAEPRGCSIATEELLAALGGR